MTDNDTITRRLMLKKIGALAGASTLLGTTSSLALAKSALLRGGYAGINDHRSLVCIFLFGGNDSFNTIVPYPVSDYDAYANIRQSLSLPRNTLLPLAGTDYALHPALSGTRSLFDSGRLGVVSNVGNLFAPTTRDDFLNGTATLPPDLFSHSHQQEIFQTNQSPSVSVSHPGWGGLMSDLLVTANDQSPVPPTITMIGDNLWQAGEDTQQLSVSPFEGAVDFLFLNDESWPPWQSSRAAAWDQSLDIAQQNLLGAEIVKAFRRTQDQIAVLGLALDDVPQINTPYNQDNYLATQLRMVANMIAVREALGMRRQMFFVAAGGFDTHGNQLADHSYVLSMLDHALTSFQATIDELNVSDSVVTFTASEFSRTLTINGDGTDHGWGGHMMVMGDPVAGGAIHGQMPVLQLGGPDDAGDAGRLIPTQSTEQYGATLARWMGVTEPDIVDIFPNLGNFASSDLGFIA